MFKRKKQDKSLYDEISKKLKKNPEHNIVEIRLSFIQTIKSKNKEKISSIIRVIKKIIKSKIPAKIKFFSLLLLKEIMETKENYLISYFIKKLKDRLSLIANYKSKLKIEKRGEDCLDIYYSQKSEENKKFSKMFYDLLLECWEHWDFMFSKKYKKIKEKVDKIRLNFKNGKNDVFYNYLENENLLEEKEIPNLYLSNVNNTFNTNVSNESNSINFSNTSGRFLKNDLIKKELENDQDFREKLGDVVRSVKKSEDFPFEDFEYFDRTIYDQLGYFTKNEGIVKKNGNFDDFFVDRFFKDFEITNNLKVCFEAFKTNHNKDDFIRNLKIILQKPNQNNDFTSTNFTKKNKSEYNYNSNEKIDKNKEERNKIFKKFELQNEFPPIEEDSREFNESRISRNFQSNIYSKRKSNISFENSKKLEDDFSKEYPIAINFNDFDIEESDSKFSPRNTTEWKNSTKKKKHTKSEVFSGKKGGERHFKSHNFGKKIEIVENFDGFEEDAKNGFGGVGDFEGFGGKNEDDDFEGFGKKNESDDFEKKKEMDFGKKNYSNDFDGFGKKNEDDFAKKNESNDFEGFGKKNESDEFAGFGKNDSNEFGGFKKKNENDFGGFVNKEGDNGFGENFENEKIGQDLNFDDFGEDIIPSVIKKENDNNLGFDFNQNNNPGFKTFEKNENQGNFDDFKKVKKKENFDGFDNNENKDNFDGFRNSKKDNSEKKEKFDGFNNNIFEDKSIKNEINFDGFNNKIENDDVKKNNYDFNFEEDNKENEEEIISEDINIKKDNFNDFEKKIAVNNEDNKNEKKDDFNFKDDFFDENENKNNISKNEISENSKKFKKKTSEKNTKNDPFQTFANLAKSEKSQKKKKIEENDLFSDFITIKPEEKKEENFESEKIKINDDIFGLDGLINIDKVNSEKQTENFSSQNLSKNNSIKNSEKKSNSNYEKNSKNSNQEISLEKKENSPKKKNDTLKQKLFENFEKNNKIPTIISSAKVTNIKKINTRIIKTPDIYTSKEQKIFKIKRNTNSSKNETENFSLNNSMVNNQFQENSELKAENEYLKQRCEILIEKIVKVKNSENLETKNLENSENSGNFEKQIFERKNDFLNQENEMLQRMNKELVGDVNSKNMKKVKENILLKDLIKELQNYINNLQVELKKERKKEFEKNVYVENLEGKVKRYNKEFFNLKKMYKEIENEIHTVRMSVFPEKENEEKFGKNQTKIDFENEKIHEPAFLKNFQRNIYKNKSEFFKNEGKDNSRMSLMLDKKEFLKKKIDEEFLQIEEKDISEHFSDINFKKHSIEPKEENLDNSLHVYKMFFDNLNKKRSYEDPEINFSKKGNSKIISTYRKSKNYESDKKSFNFEKKKNRSPRNEKLKKSERFSKTEENLKNSIKDIIGLEIDSQIQIESPQKITQTQNPVDEPKPYFNPIPSYPNFQNFKNLIKLKASSLFENSIIFENQKILIKCKTSVYIHRAEKVVNLDLTYFPLIENLKISTHILSYENINCSPPYIINQFFDSEINQSFTLKIFGDIKKVNFQKLQISVFFENEIEEIFLPLPFTINKFIKIKNVDSDKLDFFLSYCSNILDFRLVLNKNIIDSCFQIIEIFPDAIQLTDTLFLLFLDFGSNLESVLELNIIEENLLDIKLHAKHKNPLFFDFVNWFIWIFK